MILQGHCISDPATGGCRVSHTHASYSSGRRTWLFSAKFHLDIRSAYRPQLDGEQECTHQRSKPFGGALPHLSLYTSTACSSVLLCLAILSFHFTSPSLNSPNIGCVIPVGFQFFPMPKLVPFSPGTISSKSSSTSAFSSTLLLTTPELTSTSCKYSALACSAGLNAAKGERNRHCPSSSNSAGRSGTDGFKMGGIHFDGEK
jgi:hypothetical protein